MEECISVFDMLKIGVGPSSSHTLGPWRAAERFLSELQTENLFDKITRVKVDLYGSLSLTGKGHATDLALMLGLSGQDPEYIPVQDIDGIIKNIKNKNEINLANNIVIPFYFLQDIVFNKNFLPFHANGLTFTAYLNDKTKYTSTFYSIGGGFVVKEDQEKSNKNKNLKCAFPYLIENAQDLLTSLKNWDEDMIQRKSTSYDDVENFPNKFTADYRRHGLSGQQSRIKL